VLTFTPSADDLAAAGDDPLAIVVSVYNADTGEFEVVPTTLNDDGTVSAVVASIGMPVEALAQSVEEADRRAIATDQARIE
jgi:hypothetical protein